MADFMRDLRNAALKDIPLKSTKKRDEIMQQLHLLWAQGGGTITFIDDNGKEQKITLSFNLKEGADK